MRTSVEHSYVLLAVVTSGALVTICYCLGAVMDRLREDARRDPVTQVGNRRQWEESLATEVERALRSKMPLSLVMLDVDHLKRLNDLGGHAAGDEALSLVGRVLRKSCRARDAAARFGGDEFAVLLPRTRAAEARVVAERIRAALQKERIGQGEPLEKLLTVSMGIAELSCLDEPRAHNLFQAADRALYRAKHGGRDRIEVFERAGISGSHVVVLEDWRKMKKKPSHPKP